MMRTVLIGGECLRTRALWRSAGLGLLALATGLGIAVAAFPQQALEPSATGQPDQLMAGIQAALSNLASPDLGALGQAFDTKVRKPDDASAASGSAAVELIELGDLDGDGVPEVVLKVRAGEASQPDAQTDAAPDSWQGLFVLSWDGARWKASALAATGRVTQFKVVRLGENMGLALALVNVVGDGAVPYPVLFRLQQHEAVLLWDSQSEDNRYNALEHGQIEFQDDAKAEQTLMIVTGRADPGLLEFQPGGRRGFSARCAYTWDGEGYIPGRTVYSPGPDNNLYHFIAALHLHDFRSAYSLIEPGQFLGTDAPSLEQFRRLVETRWPEFLDDQVFEAREATGDSPDALAFELPDKHYVYRPTLSNDGKFLLKGLERRTEMPAPEPGGDAP